MFDLNIYIIKDIYNIYNILNKIRYLNIYIKDINIFLEYFQKIYYRDQNKYKNSYIKILVIKL